MSKLSLWAAACNCAVVLVGHFTKRSCANELYRGLGSVDIVALARSVLQVELFYEEPGVRALRQVKSSLASQGEILNFRITPDGCFKWQCEFAPIQKEAQPFQYQKEPVEEEPAGGKLERAAHLIIGLLMKGPKKATYVTEQIEKTGMCLRTIRLAKKRAGIVSERKNGVWYWKLPTKDAQYPSVEQMAGEK